MTTERDDRDVDEEFARLLEGEGVRLDRSRAPQELPDGERRAASLRRLSEGESLSDASGLTARDRARAAHPSAGSVPPPDADTTWRASDRDPDLSDDEVIYGDFEAPDPDLPTTSSASLWSWTGLLCGIAIMFAVVFTPGLSATWAAAGAAVSVVSLVSLLARAPRRPRGGDGAEV